MARVSVKFNDRAFKNDVLKAFNKVKRNKQMLNDVGDFLVKRIASEGKRGRPLNEERSFPELEAATIKNRRYLKKFNKTARVYSPARSNLSLTGQLWNSLAFFLRSRDIIEVKFSKRRKPYLSGTGRFQKQNDVNSRNQSLADQLFEGVRSKNGLKRYKAFEARVVAKDININKRINSIVRKFLRRALRVAELSKR